jgi:hypothetical protein
MIAVRELMIFTLRWNIEKMYCEYTAAFLINKELFESHSTL